MPGRSNRIPIRISPHPIGPKLLRLAANAGSGRNSALSGDPAQEYFSDGLTEELICALSRIASLRVISRTSVMTYKGSGKSLPVIAKELSVDAIVEGSVARSDQRVRIT
jgi:hypothetical protein